MAEFHSGGNDTKGGTLTAQQSSADTADLLAGVGALASLVAGSLGLPELLTEVAGFAVRAIPGADGAGVTLLQADQPGDTIEALAASAPFVAEIDHVQYVTLNEGPCITAVQEGRTVRSGFLGGEDMWPLFGPHVSDMGIHSALSLPLLMPGKVIGAINVYAHGKDVFDEHAAGLGELFAKPAAVAVHNAQILSQALALTVQLRAALSVRPVIDQAIGLLRGRGGLSAEDALAQLRAMSQSEHRKMVDIAQSILDEAVRRARARRSRT
jgi:GAF domain-containing protein